MFPGPSTLIIFIKTKFKSLEPLYLLVDVILCALGADDISENNASISMEFISPIAVVLLRSEVNFNLFFVVMVKRQIGRFSNRVNGSYCRHEFKRL